MDVGDLWFFGGGEAEEVAPRTWFVPAFANVAVLETDEGLVMVDTGTRQSAKAIREAIRRKTQAPLHTVVLTHGHLDHAFGLGPWIAAGERPRVVAHRGIRDRFERYARTRGLNEHINRIQFGFDRIEWPADFPAIDLAFEDALTLTIGGETIEVRHGRGETDDAAWVFAPSRRTICSGDFWISCAPNAGNPQKVQRYAEGWADTLEAMAKLGAEVLLPGHGPPMREAARIHEALGDASAYLRSIVAQVLAGLNAGHRHDDIVASVRVPDELAAKPYLQPVYDRPEFIARNVIRLHGGWWSGLAADLMPSPPATRAQAIVGLAGGVERVVEKARALAEADLPLACHLAEWAMLAEPANVLALRCARDLFKKRSEAETSLMARGIYSAVVRDAERSLGES